MENLKKRNFGDSWFGKDRRPYIMVKAENIVRAEKSPAFEYISVLAATGAECTTINEDVLKRLGIKSAEELRLHIVVKDKDNNKEYRVKPTLGPMADRHYNSEQGVIGMDVFIQLECNIRMDWGNDIFELTLEGIDN